MHPEGHPNSNRRTTRVRVAALAALGAAGLVAGGRPETALALDGAVQNPANGHWYAYMDGGGDWATCRDDAVAAGGYLATVTSPEEHAWIVENLGIAGKPAAWLGASDASSEGTWTWLDGEEFAYSNWAPGEPSDASGGENWLAMASDGTWLDEPATQAMSGCIVEWDTDPGEQGPTQPPTAPTNLVAAYTPGAGVALTWNDNSGDETGFLVERMPAGLDWSLRRTTDLDVGAWTDYALFPAKTYAYRVAAFNAAGVSEYSNDVSITTSAGEALPAPPNAPAALAAVAGSASVELTWADNSGDETFFDLERAAGGAAFAKLPSRPADSVSFTDEAVHPGWPYAYRVRALGLQGPSAFSQNVSVTLPPTLAVAMSSGTLKRASRLGRDAIRAAASLTSLATSGVPALAPVGEGLELQIGPAAAPVLVSIAANDAAWKTKARHGQVVKATWKSRKGVSPKVAVTVDFVRGTLSVAASGANFAQDASANVRLLFASGESGGAAFSAWTQRKPGVLKFQ